MHAHTGTHLLCQSGFKNYALRGKTLDPEVIIGALASGIRTHSHVP